jgi:hypothetical protein
MGTGLMMMMMMIRNNLDDDQVCGFETLTPNRPAAAFLIRLERLIIQNEQEVLHK